MFQPKKQVLLTHTLTQGCPGCQATLAGTSRQGHAELCRRHIQQTPARPPWGRPACPVRRNARARTSPGTSRRCRRSSGRRPGEKRTTGRRDEIGKRASRVRARRRGGRSLGPVLHLLPPLDRSRSVLGKPARTRPGRGEACTELIANALRSTRRWALSPCTLAEKGASSCGCRWKGGGGAGWSRPEYDARRPPHQHASSGGVQSSTGQTCAGVGGSPMVFDSDTLPPVEVADMGSRCSPGAEDLDYDDKQTWKDT